MHLAKSFIQKQILPQFSRISQKAERKSCLHHTFLLQVEAKLIDKLDSLMSEGKGDETYRELFNSM